jgi:hypothetical protein
VTDDFSQANARRLFFRAQFAAPPARDMLNRGVAHRFGASVGLDRWLIAFAKPGGRSRWSQIGENLRLSIPHELAASMEGGTTLEPSGAAAWASVGELTNLTRRLFTKEIARRNIMDRRELLGVLGAGAAGLVALRGTTARADDEGHEHEGHIKTIAECAKVCNEAAHHCVTAVKAGGPHAELHAKSYEAAMDCQAFCTLTAALMARSSPMAKYAHQACAGACRDCAAACDGHQDEIMKACVKACRECENVCRQMAGGTA